MTIQPCIMSPLTSSAGRQTTSFGCRVLV